ncbi:MAG: HAMP domain-containing histidine kinase [Crocinitomicaceae bacterium]|nr:HAMP domain-containing histidine kinase [Crocinitomicaceae bacterium]
MGKIRVNIVIVFVVVAVISLMLIQAYQTKQMFDKKSHQFTEKVQTTLERIAVRHEKAEDIRRFFDIANTNFSGHYKDILKEEFQQLLAPKETIIVKDTIIWENGNQENYILVQGQSFDSLIGLKAEQRVLAKDVRQLRDFYKGKNTSDSVGVAIHLNRDIVKKMFQKARFVNDMMLQAFRENLYDGPENAFDVAFLDSVIRTELKDDKLPSKYQFVVVNEAGNSITCKTDIKQYNAQLDRSEAFSTYLFPSNLFDEKLTLYVDFTLKNSFLLKEMWLPLLVNLSLVLLIFWALMFMFKTILTQKKLSEMKNDFISNMTHEFRTPISTISLACQAMNDDDVVNLVDTNVQPFIRMIDNENQRLSVLVDSILQSATLEKGDIHLKKEKVLVNEVIYDVVHRAQLRLQSTGGKIEINIGIELIYIEADKLHFTNTISNLVDNAIKYSEDAPNVVISMDSKDNLLTISVSDQGIGIKKEHLNKIFDKLYRIPTGNVHNVKGFGLGLSYVKGICDMHGWKISVISKYGEGSTFTIEIKQ